MKKRADPPKQQTVKKSAIVTQKVQPARTKPHPSVQTNVIEDDDGKTSTSFQHKVHMSPSVTRIISPEVPVPPPRVQTAQPPRVDTEGPSSNFISKSKKTPITLSALTAQCRKTHEVNAVTHQIYGVDQEYRHLIKCPEKKIWERSFVNELKQLAQVIRGVKWKNAVIFILKAQVSKDQKVTYGKIVCEVKPKKEEK